MFFGKSASRSKPSAHRHSSLKFCTYTHAPFFSWQFKFWPIFSYQLDSSRPSFVNKYIQTSMFFLGKFPNTWPCLFLTKKLHFLVYIFSLMFVLVKIADSVRIIWTRNLKTAKGKLDQSVVKNVRVQTVLIGKQELPRKTFRVSICCHQILQAKIKLIIESSSQPFIR